VLSVGGLQTAGRTATRAAVIQTPGEGRNLAAHKPYTVNRRPDYGVAIDSDHAQLTNGVYTRGYFWTQSTTAGWVRANVQPVVITIDLGAVESIGGASYSTAAGAAAVHWPMTVFVLTSEDDSTWYLVGDLIALDRATQVPPLPDVYGTHRYSTTRLATRGRYVAFVIASDFYVFCDEIEVFSGAALPPRPQGRPVPDPLTFYRTGSRLLRWIDTVSQRLNRLPDPVRRRVPSAGPIDQPGATFVPRVFLQDRFARLTVPYTREQEELFTLNGRAMQAGGAPPLRIWKLHRYDPLDPIQSPSAVTAPELAIECMNGERRADAIVFTNGTGQPQRVHVRVTGLPGGPNPTYISVSEVQFVETAARFLAASALQEVTRTGSDFVVTVPAGINRQLWFSVQPTDVPPGVYRGALRVQSERNGASAQTVPFTLRVSAVRFPARPRMHLGGWDYTNGKGANDVTAANRDQLVQFLQSRYVDTPWATSSVLGRPAARDFSEDCGLRRDFDFSELDDWLTRWRSARLFLVFLNGGDDFAGHATGTAEFRRCVGSWLTAVAARLRQNGVSPSQFGLLLVDEPITDAQAARVRVWADAVHEAGTGIFVWEDPQFRDPARDPAAAALSASDVVSPQVIQYLAMDPDARKRIRQPGGTLKRMWLYNTEGPAHSLDPYAYYQLHFWRSFREGAEGASFWSFSDAGGGSAWNEYASPSLVYAPEYLAPDGVTDSKHMMAIVEGIEDFEYLSLLRDRLAARGPLDTSEVVRTAARLLADAPDTVLAALVSSQGLKYDWAIPRDRFVADRMRARVLRALDALAQKERP
jgi:hypothetical protein